MPEPALDTVSDPMNGMKLPPLYCPFTPTTHPEAEQINAQAVAWWERHSEFPADPAARARLLGARGPVWVANSSPDASAERLAVVAPFFIFAFAIDDWLEGLDDADEVADACGMLWRQMTVPDRAIFDAPIVSSWLGIIDGFRRIATPTQYRRWVHYMSAFFHGTAWEARIHRQSCTPDPNTYTTLALGSAGVFGFVPLPEIIHQQEALEHEMADSAVIAFIESAGLLIKWINDLSSYAKDLLDGSKDQVTNPITVLAKHLHCPPQQAVVELIHLWNRTMQLVVALREQLLPQAGPGLAHVLDDTVNGIANILTWHDNNPRYAMIARAFSVTDQPPADLDLTPPPIPSIAWWWTLTP
ncbi:terpene synthase family metal binding domain-containing protein [Nocardia nova SH22a]|uniref:Terpene synthase family metal binding domain-containing protein n=1 Tax=Nocardia nova SH22a TaxID=1415166 RepID=W5TSI4_9NOCA|nr:terpene synthase family protein [Nocardia nova]AHH22134.1 terpene synthase family metal binding domain-containing protein [Nocardia nova SH22a]